MALNQTFAFSIPGLFLLIIFFLPVILGVVFLGWQRSVRIVHQESGLSGHCFFGYSWTYFLFGFFVPIFRGEILIGLLHPTSGKVFIDNKELTVKYIKNWQNKFSYAEQNTLLLNDSVVNNIKFSLPNTSLSEESFQDALKICSVWDEVLALPDGINTFLGEKGNAVSGGQKQRIGMARAIYKNSEILIFDEPTSGLDEATEIEVVKNLKRHLFGRTVIVVTHSKAVQGFCDRIINIDT